MNNQIRNLMIANKIAGRFYEKNLRNLDKEGWGKYCNDLYDSNDCIITEEDEINMAEEYKSITENEREND